MTSKKYVVMLIVCIVILAVAHADDFEDKPISNAGAPPKADPPKDKCYVDCEKHCIAQGFASSFCTLQCENSCRQGHILHGRRRMSRRMSR
ncbi:hypothetical protein OSB04_022736 [Centaurea solstitialis]|uniref:Uncharacterized protein n=1 Tax=Centaurea solstitialis TaxID=347529 RepID=A0AA38SHR1_9ASTR|nr:hypothetical protein OSB04_022736 [Centaurea solstitialis]